MPCARRLEAAMCSASRRSLHRSPAGESRTTNFTRTWRQPSALRMHAVNFGCSPPADDPAGSPAMAASASRGYSTGRASRAMESGSRSEARWARSSAPSPTTKSPGRSSPCSSRILRTSDELHSRRSGPSPSSWRYLFANRRPRNPCGRRSSRNHGRSGKRSSPGASRSHAGRGSGSYHHVFGCSACSVATERACPEVSMR